ncbi:uncharacterized protein LOC104893960 [Beta vulgaris subsp. vulgaris]|nr:uncharacterized protein LOC104893960 [Beta vulgaris subsp. vulgaris]
MVRISLSSFIFMLMFTLLEARDSIFKHSSYQGLVEMKVSPQSENVAVEAKGIHPTIVAKEIRSSEVITEEESSKMKLDKRKLASQGSFKKAKEQAKMSIDGTSSKISGRNTEASRRIQYSEAKCEDKNSKGSTKEMKNLSNSRKQKGNRRRISKDNFQKLESKDLEAANEVWTFMNRDYPGNGGVRHNPPTNNR